MKKLIFPYFLFLFLISFSGFCSATSITFSNLDLTEQKISLYYYNGSFIEEIYSNETFILPNSSIDYVLVIEPNQWISVSNPNTLFSTLLSVIPFIFIMVLVIGFSLIIIALIYKGTRSKGAFR